VNDRPKRFGLQAWLVTAFISLGALASLAVALVVFPTLEANIRKEQANQTRADVARVLQSSRGFNSQFASVNLVTLASTLEGDVRLMFVPSPGRYEAVFTQITNGYLDSERLTEAGTLSVNGALPQLHTRVRETPNGDLIDAAITVRVDERPDWVLEASAPVRGTEARLAFIRRRILLAVAIVLGLASLAGVAIARILGARIRRLAGTAATLARGDLSARADEVVPAELSTLGESLNAMAARLEGLVAETVSDRDRARALVASLSEGVLAVGPDGEVTVANDAARTLLRMPEGAEVVTLMELPEAVRAVVRTALDDPNAELVHEATLPGGIEVLMTTSPPVKGAGIILTLRDVTEERRLARARRDLIANVSHELKTPLTAVKGFLELLEDDRLPPERRAEFLDLMGTEVGRLERLVAEQLELARLDAGALALEREHLDLGELATEVTATRQALAEREGVELVVSTAATEVVVDADAARVEQILLILLDNAIRHTPHGGKVTVGVSSDGTFGALSVRDTGSGISLDAQQFIFDRFFQADPSREGRGHGLGLAIARGLADAHGGSIDVRSAPQVGSVFTVRLPLATATARAPAGATSR
jgi:signal transduction histidine kinase